MIDALGIIGPRGAAAAPALSRLVATGDVNAAEAAKALRRIGSAAAAVVPTLVRALASQESGVRLMAADTLRFVGCGSGTASHALLKALGDSDPAMRELAALALGGCTDSDRAVGSLGERLADTDPRVRLAAAEALGGFGPAAATESSRVRGSTDDPDERVRAQAVRSLASIDPQALVDDGGQLLSDPIAGVRLELARALRSRGETEPWIGGMIACLAADPDEAVRRAASATSRPGSSTLARGEGPTRGEQLPSSGGCPELRPTPTPAPVATPAPRTASGPTPTRCPYRYVQGGEIGEPVKVSGPEPDYAEQARRAGVEGAVVLDLTISGSGEVIDLRVLKGLPLGLTEAAVEAVRQWRFTPAKREGRAVEVLYTVTVNFALKR